MRMFPILVTHDRRGRPLLDCPSSVPWDIVANHEKQARANHFQSLERLAERGGLSPLEFLAVIADKPFLEMKKQVPTDELAIELMKAAVQAFGGAK